MNKFVSKYKELRNKGYSDLEAMGMVSCYVASNGSMKDLEALYDYHLNDFMQETNKVFNKLEEPNYERITSAV